MSTSTSPSPTSEDIVDFAHAVPPPLNSLILRSASHVAWLRWAVDVVGWKRGHRVHSWLLLAAWWACCIFGPFAIKYALPAFLILPLALRVAPKKPRTASELTAEGTFQQAVSNLLVIQQGIQPPVDIHLPSLPPLVALRVLGIVIPPYWIMSRILGARAILAILGSVVLCSHADWAHKISKLLWGSAWFRAGVAYIWSKMTGQPQLFSPLSIQAISRVSATSTTELRLLFTIFENQRWWMGLDWTAALLPAERPSWATANLQPVSPPTSFTLPEPTTSYIPHPEKPKFRIQRKATWRWEDMDWKVCINRNEAGSPPPSRPQKTQKPLSSPSIDTVTPDTAKETTNYDSTRRLRNRLKEKMGEAKPSSEQQAQAIEEQDSSSQSDDEPRKVTSHGNSTFTDADGWIFGDNKWENPSDKGGMGKYTRTRRWTRIAVLREESEEVGPGIMGVVRAQPAQSVISAGVSQIATGLSIKENPSPLPSPSSPEAGTTASDRLRQRLQAAIRRESSGG